MADAPRFRTHMRPFGVADPQAYRRLLARPGLQLDRAELLVLLDTVQADTIVGLPAEALATATPAERDVLLARGKASLLERGLLRVDDEGAPRPDLRLIALALLITRPQVVSLTIRNLNGQGKQLYLHYYADGVSIEHTLPTPETHRFVALMGVEEICERIIGVLPLHAAFPSPEVADVPQDAFLAAKRLLEQHHFAEARAAFASIIHPEPVAKALFRTFLRPTLIATVAMFRCEEEQAAIGAHATADTAASHPRVRTVDARNILVVCDENCAWLIGQRIPGEQQLKIQHIEQDVLYYTLRNLFQAMRSPTEHVPSPSGEGPAIT